MKISIASASYRIGGSASRARGLRKFRLTTSRPVTFARRSKHFVTSSILLNLLNEGTSRFASALMIVRSRARTRFVEDDDRLVALHPGENGVTTALRPWSRGARPKASQRLAFDARASLYRRPNHDDRQRSIRRRSQAERDTSETYNND